MTNTVKIIVAADFIPGVTSVPMFAEVDDKGGAIYNVTADMSKGQTQEVTFQGDYPTNVAHTVMCKLNAYSGTAPNGTNLHFLSVSIDNVVNSTVHTLTKVDWYKCPIAAATATAPVAPPVVAKPKKRDVLVGGYGGFLNLTLDNTKQLRATQRVELYEHNSIVTAANSNKVKAILASLVPVMSSDGVSWADEAGTNTFFKKGDAYNSYDQDPNLVIDSIILNCGSSDTVATDANLLKSNIAWMDATRASLGEPNLTIAPVVTPGGNDAFLNTDYDTHAHWANQRALEAHGKRGCDDLPVSNMGQTSWFNFMIRHGASVMKAGLEYDLIVSPSNNTTFFADMKAALTAFWTAKVFPTRIIIESYTPGVGATIGDETDPSTLNYAALWVAQNKPVNAS